MTENDYKNGLWYPHLLLCAEFAKDKKIRDACNGAVDELARLKAVVDEWPKTEDGTPITEGMRVFVPAEHDGTNPILPKAYKKIFWLRDQNGEPVHSFIDYYVTEEAAEAARSQQ